jgi:hypothetical protein
MNMITKKLKPAAAPVDGDDVLAVLDARLRELDARRATITKQIIALPFNAGSRASLVETELSGPRKI